MYIALRPFLQVNKIEVLHQNVRLLSITFPWTLWTRHSAAPSQQPGQLGLGLNWLDKMDSPSTVNCLLKSFRILISKYSHPIYVGHIWMILLLYPACSTSNRCTCSNMCMPYQRDQSDHSNLQPVHCNWTERHKAFFPATGCNWHILWLQSVCAY